MHRPSACFLLLAPLVLLGCGVVATGTPNAIQNVSGHVFGGQQPISGSTVQLYAVGTTGNASAATPLLSSPVTTDTYGNFNITGLWTCAPGTLIYLTATGGNPGLGSGLSNPNIALMDAWVPCDSLTPQSFLNINEVTTVAAVEALYAQMSSPANVGSSASGAAALAASFTLASQYADPSTGVSPGLNVPSGQAAPAAEINTLANVLSTCVNSAGGIAVDTRTPCGQLFSLTSNSSTTPTDTVAALRTLSSPTLGASLGPQVYALAPPTAPFQPVLTAAPNDFVLHLQPTSPSGSVLYAYDVLIAQYNFLPYPTQTITNTATSNVYISNIAYSSSSSSSFSFTNNCPGLLAPAATCNVYLFGSPMTQ